MSACIVAPYQVMWGYLCGALYRLSEADTRQSGSFRACVSDGETIQGMKNSLRSNSFISLNITVRHKPETARTALYAAAQPIKCIHHNSNSPCKAISYRYHQIPTGITIKYNKFCLKYRFCFGIWHKSDMKSFFCAMEMKLKKS